MGGDDQGTGSGEAVGGGSAEVYLAVSGRVSQPRDNSRIRSNLADRDLGDNGSWQINTAARGDSGKAGICGRSQVVLAVFGQDPEVVGGIGRQGGQKDSVGGGGCAV